MSTFTARIHSVRSPGVSFLHSRRTLGVLQVLLATAADTRRQMNRARATPRKEPICEKRRSREQREFACISFIPRGRYAKEN